MCNMYYIEIFFGRRVLAVVIGTKFSCRKHNHFLVRAAEQCVIFSSAFCVQSDCVVNFVCILVLLNILFVVDVRSFQVNPRVTAELCTVVVVELHGACTCSCDCTLLYFLL